MKAIKALYIIAFALTIASVAEAQQYNYKLDGPFMTTRTFRVNGVCEMCKHRIENSINKFPGIWSSDWDVNSKTLMVRFDRTKVSPDKIQQLVVATGHDIEMIKASYETYIKLPDCCHYERNI